MPGYDHQRAHDLLRRLIELPAAERPAVLDAGCGGDPALRAAVLRVLRAAESPDSVANPGTDWMEPLWHDLLMTGPMVGGPLRAGDRVGPYRVVEETGRGGMAVVYRATRDDGQIERQVAIKVVNPGVNGAEAVLRFERERQILADLDHPNIARLLDGGQLPDGRPYFIMEYVHGLRIDRYCDDRRLDVSRRLALFRVVAQAVDYAHNNLVVHRDLKPSNILVTASGEVKLLDFGIARLLDSEKSAKVATRTFMHLMTPEYASPEQLRGERISIASDVYQLGLLLYELLAGRRPFELAGLSPAEIEHLVCDRLPPRPGSLIEDNVARARATSRGRLATRLRGDLDNIVLKALRKEPGKRYSSADRLQQDIHYHLAGLPVAARAQTWRYRGGRYLRRHAAAVTAALFMLTLVSILTVLYTVRIHDQRNLAEQAYLQAEAEAVKLRQVSDFLRDLFRDADPREARGTGLTARELLDRGAARLQRDLQHQPGLQVELMYVLGSTYLEMELYAPAGRMLNRALELHHEQPGTDVATTVAISNELGLLWLRRGNFQQAARQLRSSLALIEHRPEQHAASMVATLVRLSEAYWNDGRHESAREVLEQALEMHERFLSDDTHAAADILSNMATALLNNGEPSQAEALYQRALTLLRQRLGEDHPRVGSLLMNLALAKTQQGDHDGLEALYRRNLAIQRQTYGPYHSRVARALNNLGYYLFTSGQIEEALSVAHQALEAYTRSVGPTHPEIVLPLIQIGNIHHHQGQLAEARDHYARAVAQRGQSVVEDQQFDLLLFIALVRLGRLESLLGDGDGRHYMNRALINWRQAPESRDPRMLIGLYDLGDWLVGQRRCDEAVPLLQRVVQALPPAQLPANEWLTEPEVLMAACA